MKKITTTIIAMLCIGTIAIAQVKYTKVWETDTVTVIKPESVLYDATSNTLFVSNMDIGTIDRLSTQGAILQNDWVTGLTDNKGLGIYKGRLYTAENSAVAVIDIKTATIIKRIPIQGAQRLNDVAVDKRGIIYVSDTKGGSVYKIENDTPTLHIANIPGANGLLTLKNDLYIAAATSLLKVNANKQIKTIADNFESGLDGIVRIGKNNYLVTNYKGMLYYVKPDGKKEIGLDHRAEQQMMNDISYDKKTKTVFVPSYNKNKVTAYRLH